ncbi:hypothetical protein PF003_g14921 [Phytophthora fragariae]|nr:hypothetical protein PF003_g14921 [Phytophthora fragariae]
MHGLPTDCVHGFVLCVPAQLAAAAAAAAAVPPPPPAASMGTTASSKLGSAQGEWCRMRCMHGLLTDCVYGIVFCVLPSPAQLAAAAAVAVPRHHRPRAWGRPAQGESCRTRGLAWAAY